MSTPQSTEQTSRRLDQLIEKRDLEQSWRTSDDLCRSVLYHMIGWAEGSEAGGSPCTFSEAFQAAVEYIEKLEPANV